MDGRYVDVYEGRDGNLKVHVKEVHITYYTTTCNTHHVYYIHVLATRHVLLYCGTCNDKREKKKNYRKFIFDRV